MILSDISISKPAANRSRFHHRNKGTRCKGIKDLNSAVSCMKAAGSEVERQFRWCSKPVVIVNTNHEQCSASGITIFFTSLILLNELSNCFAKSEVFLLHTLLYPRSGSGIR
jgi:hypothetical protein